MIARIQSVMNSLPKITRSRLFFAVYILIGAATFRHSTIGFASLEGSIAWGALSALAVDVLMILFAHAIRQDGIKFSMESLGLVIGLTVPALASIYTQLLFAVTEAQILEVAPGALWMEEMATNITNVRVVGLPALLPILAIVAALIGKQGTVETMTVVEHGLELSRQREQHDFEHSTTRANLQSKVAQVQELESQLSGLAEQIPELEFLRKYRTIITGIDPSTAKGIATLVGFVSQNGGRPKPGKVATALSVSVPAVSPALKEGARMREELGEALNEQN